MFKTLLLNKSLLLCSALALSFGSMQFERLIEDPVAFAAAHPDRPDADKARDADRHPGKVLNFFGIKPGMHVADFMAGDGYYTEIVSRAVGEGGMVYCQNSPTTLKHYGEKLTKRLEGRGFENVARVDSELTKTDLPKGLDAALLIRFYHDFGWMNLDRAAFNKMVFEQLKPGGIFGVLDHVAADGAGMSVGQTLHRIDPNLVRYEIEAAGFVLEAESFLLRNSADTLDWNIFSDNGARNDKTDRFIYLFRKPLE
ncbi:MAG: putative methyltransferase [Planctomycetota bacterium]|jgi:predicted methyltransferase